VRLWLALVISLVLAPDRATFPWSSTNDTTLLRVDDSVLSSGGFTPLDFDSITMTIADAQAAAALRRGWQWLPTVCALRASSL
jgi:hypothetical protein